MKKTMKNGSGQSLTLQIIVAALALAFTLHIHAQTPTPTPTPLVIAPVSTTVMQPAYGTLTAAQVTALQTQLAAAGITFSGGQVRMIQIVLPPTLTGTAVAHYAVTFYPATH